MKKIIFTSILVLYLVGAGIFHIHSYMLTIPQSEIIGFYDSQILVFAGIEQSLAQAINNTFLTADNQIIHVNKTDMTIEGFVQANEYCFSDTCTTTWDRGYSSLPNCPSGSSLKVVNGTWSCIYERRCTNDNGYPIYCAQGDERLSCANIGTGDFTWIMYEEGEDKRGCSAHEGPLNEGFGGCVLTCMRPIYSVMES